MLADKSLQGHLCALLTIFIWGITFVSTKLLLVDFSPIEILFSRFVIGYVTLWVVYPRKLSFRGKKDELTFAAAGLCGITLYYLLENIALTYTLASNVGVIISVAPFFTAMLMRLFMKGEEKLQLNFFVGFLLAITGIGLISFQDKSVQINLVGDFLALLAAATWSCYSLLTRKIAGFGYNTIQSTRRIFAYGIIFMIPAMIVFGFKWDMSRFADMANLFNMLFLGLGASALCFVTWSFSVKVIGAVKTSIYIYLVPVITVLTSVVVLNEKVTTSAWLGIALTLVGLIISERRFVKLKERKPGIVR